MDTTVSTKGQVIIPKSIRDELGIDAGAKLRVFTEGRRIVMEAARPFPETSLDQVGGMGKRWYSGPAIPESEWQPALDAAMRRRWGHEYDDSGS
ncbi:AbrB/MazE/SpoVT family DNA-binding domain-containing protein [Phreatobacter cathodiphilus]|nr:AbrB/MazE/SpoVT family DNA-binding domain-containing protein [Phreatobacter cathodiphilus]